MLFKLAGKDLKLALLESAAVVEKSLDEVESIWYKVIERVSSHIMINNLYYD